MAASGAGAIWTMTRTLIIEDAEAGVRTAPAAGMTATTSVASGGAHATTVPGMVWMVAGHRLQAVRGRAGASDEIDVDPEDAWKHRAAARRLDMLMRIGVERDKIIEQMPGVLKRRTACRLGPVRMFT